MASEVAVRAPLRDRGADGIPHPGGTLDRHLERVQQRLARLGLPENVQWAGRVHAVYGTDGFAVALLGLDERPLLAGIVGEETEQLVYRYGACDRSRTWTTLAVSRRVWDRFTGAEEVLDDAQLRAFADLSIVNELDVAEHSEEFLGRYGEYFRRLTDSWSAVLSSAVAVAVAADALAVFGCTARCTQGRRADLRA